MAMIVARACGAISEPITVISGRRDFILSLLASGNRNAGIEHVVVQAVALSGILNRQGKFSLASTLNLWMNS